MATVRMGGFTFQADVIEQTLAGDWLVRARQHTGRTSPGTTVLVKDSEITMAPGEKPVTATDLNPVLGPAAPSAGLADLEAAMAEERKTLPPVTELLKGVKTVPDRPTTPRMGRNPQPQPQHQAGQNR